MRHRCLGYLAAWLSFVVGPAHAQVIVFVPGKTASYPSTTTVTTLAGTVGSKSSADGQGPAAQFIRPMGVALAPDGSLYVADGESHTIRRLTPAGAATTLTGAAGKGHADGGREVARFFSPVGVAADAQGNLYVADADNHTIRKITPTGDVSTIAGTAGAKGGADGRGAGARFKLPHSVAVAADGVLYVADTFNHTIRKITPAGDVTTLAGLAGHKGAADGTGAAARFRHPAGLAVDASGNLYVTDYGNLTIRKISTTGEVTTLAGAELNSGHADGPGPEARFEGPASVAVDAQGTLYVADGTTIRLVK